MNGKSYNDFFDDDFEVTYEGDLPGINIHDTEDTPSDPSEDQEEQKEKASARRRQSSRPSGKRKDSSREKSRSGRRPDLVSPVKKTVQTGAHAVMRLIQTVCRIATLVLIAVITFLLASSYLQGLFSYGDPAKAISEKNYTMGTYAAFAVLLLLIEIISFLWALTGPRVAREHGRSFKTDTGRGMFSFILIGAGSVLAYLFASLIPESPAMLTGLKDAVTLYGNLSARLVPLCIAGVVSCILRKIFSR